MQSVTTSPPPLPQPRPHPTHTRTRNEQSLIFQIIRDQFIVHGQYRKLWIVNWKWLAMECSVNYTIVWWSFTVWPHDPSGELTPRAVRRVGLIQWKNIKLWYNYRTLHGKPFSVNYPFYPIAHLPITRMQNRDQYRMSIRGVSGLALEESKMHTFSRI